METKPIIVCGGINIDICGKSFDPLIPVDSNPGTVRLSMGGVGRNIAHNLRLLDTPVTMLTSLGGDLYAKRIQEHCETVGIDLSHARHVPEAATSTYVFLAGPDGDMALAVCDAEIANTITPAYLAEQLPLLNEAAAVVLETNLPSQSIRYLAEHCTAPLFADPVSVTKSEKLREVLGGLHTLKPNKIEAELLSGVKITDEASLEQAADALLATGLKRVFISLGADGLYCADGAQRLRCPCPTTVLVNATGGGDALMAGLVKAYTLGLSLEDSARLALACSAIAVEGTQTINESLNTNAAFRRANLTL